MLEPDTRLYDETKSLQTSEQVAANSILSALVGIQWRGQDCSFCDWKYFPSINLWRDYLPAEIASKLPGLSRGDEIKQLFRAGELFETGPHQSKHSIPEKNFQPPANGLFPVQPATGRYYPADFFKQVPGIFDGNKFPCRITAIGEDMLEVDFNHPLGDKEIALILRIESVNQAGAERGGRCNDIIASSCNHGPGMQDSLPKVETDFWSGNPFSRLDEGNDSEFFKQPSLTPFWDRAALQQVSQLYHDLIKPESDVLDLMAGVHSPLQESNVNSSSITCAGLNAVELSHNPVCTKTLTLDINQISRLPFDDEQFDVVLIHAAIEYVTNPALLTAEIKRVLKTSGRLLISFSNRSVGEKTVQVWAAAHEFERPAIVLSYLRSCGGFGHFNSYSKRGVFRPEDDALADKLLYSDPVYMIWADKL